MFSAIENACRHMEQYINNKIESGQNVLHSKDVCVIDLGFYSYSLELLFTTFQCILTLNSCLNIDSFIAFVLCSLHLQICARVIADIVCNLVFGLDAKAFDEKSDFVEQSLTMFYSAPYETIRSAAYVIFPWLRKIYPERFTTSEFTVWFRTLFDQAIQIRKENNISRDDYLNYLIELREKKNIPMNIIYAHAFTYFLDGFETTAYALGSAINNLAGNKDCQEKLRAEINSYEHISFEDLRQMPYLDAVLNGK